MSEPTADELKARIKRLSFEASQKKMDLHDLSEDLPNGWEQIMQVAERTHQKYAELAAAKQQLAEIERSAAGPVATGRSEPVPGRD